MRMILLKRPVRAFTLVELFVVIAVLGVLIAVVLPALPRARVNTLRIKCVNNLKNVGLAFRIFASDNQDRFPMEISANEGGSLEFLHDGMPLRHFLALSNELSTPLIIHCPDDKKRKAAADFASVQRLNISYFISLEARKQPQAFLTGDRNLTTNGRPVKPGLVDVTTNTVMGWTKEMHFGNGNIAMGDGSVQQFSGPRLTQAMRVIGARTNRLVVP